MRVPFGERGLKIRAAALAGAAALGAFVLGRARLPPGVEPFLWLFFLAASLVLFFLVRRTDDDGNVEPGFLHAVLPLYLLLPGFFWVVVAGEDGDGPSWGYWSVLGESWSGAELYLLALCCVALYNLLRLNLQRLLRPRR